MYKHCIYTILSLKVLENKARVKLSRLRIKEFKWQFFVFKINFNVDKAYVNDENITYIM